MFDIPIIKEIISFFRLILEFILKNRKKNDQAIFNIPKKTITIVPLSRENSCWWSMGSLDDRPVMQVIAQYFVTNITKYDVILPVAKLQKSGTLGHVMVKDSQSNCWGQYGLPPGRSSELHMDFLVMPPFKEEGDFTSDIIVTDQFGNNHKIRGASFKYLRG
jgi:hypothetical protein